MITQEIFNSATQSHTTNIQPLIKIAKGEDTLVGLSTTAFTFDGLFYDPLLLNIPSIKESIDIENRKYKISSVNLSLSNAPYKGNRFSDKFNLLINAETQIYFKTQNANTLGDCLLVYSGRIRRMNQSETTLTLVLEDSSEQKIHKDIPKNIIPDIEFDSKFHNKPFPMAIGKIDRSPCVVSVAETTDFDIDDDGDIDQYNFIKSVIIDSHPLSKIVSDKVHIGNHFIGSVPLWIHTNDAYLGLHSRDQIDFDVELGGNTNYTALNDNTGFSFLAKWDQDAEGGLEELALNDTAANKGRVLVQREYAKIESKIEGDQVLNPLTFESGIENSDGEFIPDVELNENRASDDNPNSCVRITGTYRGAKLPLVSLYDAYFAYLKYHFLPFPSGIGLGDGGWQKLISKTKIIGREAKIITLGDGIQTRIRLPLITIFKARTDRHLLRTYGDHYATNRIIHPNNRLLDELDGNIYDFSPGDGTIGSGYESSGNTFGTTAEEYDSLYGDDPIAPLSTDLIPLDSTSYNLGMPWIANVGEHIEGSYWSMSKSSPGFTVVEVDVRIFSSQVWASGVVDNILDKDFYANIWGRPSERLGVSNFIFDPESSMPGFSFLSDFWVSLETQGTSMDFKLGDWYNRRSRLFVSRIKQGVREIKVNRWKLSLFDSEMFSDFDLDGDALVLEIEGEYISDDVEPFTPGGIDVYLKDFSGYEWDGQVNYGTYVDNYGYTNIDNALTNILPLMYPSEVIQHILTEECGYEGEFDEEEFQEVTDLHEGWRYSFTQHEIINSKKLIEQIAKSSKTFPRFKADGSFGWSTTRDTYSEDDIDLMIDTVDILSYKFDRTKLEDVKTKVKVDFWKDYASDNYVYATDDIQVGDLAYPEPRDAANIYEYYNLPVDNSDSTLVLQSDYIREYYTAEQLRNWLLSWHMNQHNLITLTLPLKYLKLEVGDVIEFSNEINNMLLYGEKYTRVMVLNEETEEIERVPLFRNGQEIYPYFMITETNKSLDKVTIKLMQLHKHDMALYDPSYVPDGDGDVVIEPDPPTGNVDGFDGTDISDIIIMIPYFLGAPYSEINTPLSEVDFQYQIDLDQNGSYDISDLILIVEFILGD